MSTRHPISFEPYMRICVGDEVDEVDIKDYSQHFEIISSEDYFCECKLEDKNIGAAVFNYDNLVYNQPMIDLFEIKKEYRGNGYGMRLAEMVIDKIKEVYPDSTEIVLYAKDEESKKFWQKVGFGISECATDSEIEMVLPYK